LFSSVDLRRAGRGFEWLDHLLGRERLVRRAWRIRVAAVGLVGSSARVRSTTKPVAIFVAGAVCLFSRHRWISLHRVDARRFDWMAVYQIVSRNQKLDLDLADDDRCRARIWNVGARVAGDL